MSSIDPKRSWDEDQGHGIADLIAANCTSPEKRMKRNAFSVGFDSEHIFEAPIGAPSSSSSSSWNNAHGLLASPNPFYINDVLDTPNGGKGMSPKTPKSDFRYFVDILSPLAIGTSPTTSLPQSEIGKNYPSSKDWSPFVGGFAAVGEEFSFSEIATNSHQPIRFSPKNPQLRTSTGQLLQQNLLNLGTHGYNADDAISPTSTERSFNMMDELSSPTLSLGLDHDSNEHFMSNKQALAARLGGSGSGGHSKQALGPNSFVGSQGQIFSNLHSRGIAGQRFGENSSGSAVGFEIPGIAAITAAAEAVDDHKKESFTNSGVTSPSILRPVRSSSFYKNSQQGQESTTSSSQVFLTDIEQNSDAGRNRKQSHGFSTSSSGAFSSPIGLQSGFGPGTGNTGVSQKHSTSSSSSSFFASGNDSLLKENATHATSIFFADKHQELNLPPKFVKQMMKQEKERIKLLEKEKNKLSKDLKNSTSRKLIISDSNSKLSNAAKISNKSKNINDEHENEDENENDHNRPEDELYGINVENRNSRPALDWEIDVATVTNNLNGNDSGRNSLINVAQNDKKNNKKLGKLGKISKMARSGSVDESSETAMISTPGISQPAVSELGSGLTQGPDSLSLLTPGGSHMHMLMRAAGSVDQMCSDASLQHNGPESSISGIGSSGSMEQAQGARVERIPGKVGRPKLSLRDIVSDRLSDRLSN